jgi:ABC-type glycerol-3-phosphate transport system permease component
MSHRFPAILAQSPRLRPLRLICQPGWWGNNAIDRPSTLLQTREMWGRYRRTTAEEERELFVGCKSLVLRVSFYLLVAVILVWNLFPFFCALLGSFRPSNALFSTNLSPRALNFGHYNEIFVRPIFVESLINSAILAGSTVLISLAFGSLCAYSVA